MYFCNWVSITFSMVVCGISNSFTDSITSSSLLTQYQKSHEIRLWVYLFPDIDAKSLSYTTCKNSSLGLRNVNNTFKENKQHTIFIEGGIGTSMSKSTNASDTESISPLHVLPSPSLKSIFTVNETGSGSLGRKFSTSLYRYGKPESSCCWDSGMARYGMRSAVNVSKARFVENCTKSA